MLVLIVVLFLVVKSGFGGNDGGGAGAGGDQGLDEEGTEVARGEARTSTKWAAGIMAIIAFAISAWRLTSKFGDDYKKPSEIRRIHLEAESKEVTEGENENSGGFFDKMMQMGAKQRGVPVE